MKGPDLVLSYDHIFYVSHDKDLMINDLCSLVQPQGYTFDIPRWRAIWDEVCHIECIRWCWMYSEVQWNFESFLCSEACRTSRQSCSAATSPRITEDFDLTSMGTLISCIVITCWLSQMWLIPSTRCRSRMELLQIKLSGARSSSALPTHRWRTDPTTARSWRRWTLSSTSLRSPDIAASTHRPGDPAADDQSPENDSN